MRRVSEAAALQAEAKEAVKAEDTTGVRLLSSKGSNPNEHMWNCGGVPVSTNIIMGTLRK